MIDKKSFIAKRSLGQNFLRDKGILKKIADFAQIEKEDIVVEVGPGEGTLTEILLEKAKKVVAVEKDERMILFLKNKFKKEIKEGKLEVVEGDILKTKIQNIILPQAQYFSIDYKLVGNIPYYITGALFKKTLESENPPKSITFVIQKEVAERIMARDNKARPSHKATAGKESILSISIKAYGEPKYGGVIKAGSFEPRPKVDSAIISIRNISKKTFEEFEISEANFFEILKAGFAHKRKFLAKNLLETSKHMSRGTLDTSGLKEIFNKCGIPEKGRAEDLKVNDWMNLTRLIFSKSRKL